MAHIELSHCDHALEDGRPLLRDVNLRVGEGRKIALVGPNGIGKSTLLALLDGRLPLQAGSRGSSGRLGVMRQFVVPERTAATPLRGASEPAVVGPSVRDASTVRDLLLTTSPPAVQAAAERLDAAERAMLETGSEAAGIAYAQALADWGDAGGYDEEVRWDSATLESLHLPYERARDRPAATLSGGEQKRLVLEALLSGPAEVLLLDEPDNFLDVPGKEWLEASIRASAKTVLFVTHDREMIARCATAIATLERGGAGATIWVHGGDLTGYQAARAARNDRADEVRRRWDEEEQKLKDLVALYKAKAAYNADMASRLQAARSRLERFRADGPPPPAPPPEKVVMRLAGGRTAKRAITCERLGLDGLMRPFSTEIWFGDRVAVVGSNGSGKSHFLRLLRLLDEDRLGHDALEPVAHSGVVRLGSRVRTGYFDQTHEHPEFTGRTLLEILGAGDADRSGLDRAGASSILNRYGLVKSAEQRFETLSGGQQARFQILLLELEGATLLLLDEPTDNLDFESAEALEQGLAGFEGAVLAVTHDRWFARTFDRFLVFGEDGTVAETDTPVWDAGFVKRSR
jgi:ATPase subunit of ABC transporter with duplicated ATPase domains